MAGKSSRKVAVEISDSFVRVAEVAAGPGRPRLLNVGQVRLRPRAVVDGVVSDVNAVAEAIQRCLKEGGFAAKEVHLGVAGLRAITREIDMPQVPESELDAAVRLQVLDVIPFPAEKTLLSARPLPESEVPEEGPTTKRAVLVAAHRDVVEPLLAAVDKAGLVALSVELTSLALVRALAEKKGQGAEAIVSVGSGLTSIVVHEDGIPHFVRTVALGGETVTAAIAAALDLPPEDAEQIKRNLDQSGPHIRAAATAASGALSSLVGEIQSSIEYYATLPGRSEVGRVVMTGGGSRLAGLTERLQQLVSCEVSAGRVLELIDTSGLKLSEEERARRDPDLATVIGLALPEPPGTKPLDLLPPEIAAARRQRRLERNVLAVAVLVVVVLLGLGALRFTKVRQAEGQVSALQQNAQIMQGDITREEGHAKTYDAITADEGVVSPILENEVDWPAVLSDLAQATPPGGVVTSVSGSYVAPAAPSPPASSAGTGGATTTTTTLPAPGVSASEAERETVTIADLNVGISTNEGYPYFRTWLQAMSTSSRFRYLSFSGLSAKGNTVSWTAQLAVLGTIESNRITRFEVTSR